MIRSEFSVTVIGSAAHASAPHLGTDAAMAGAAAVQALLSIPSRRFDPLHRPLINIGVFNAGTRVNILAGEAEIVGTIRTHDEAQMELVRTLIRRMTSDICRAYGCRTEYVFGTDQAACLL